MPLYVLILAFSFAGVAFAPLPAGAALQKVMILGLALVLIAARLTARFPLQALTIVFPFLAYTVFAFFSAYLIGGSLVYALAATQPLIFGLTVYLAFVAFPAGAREFATLRLTCQALIALQIIFVFIKLATHGVDEKVLIGTMSHAAGQLGFMLPAIAVPLLMYMLNARNRFLIYALVAGMFAFGVINEKRTVVFLLPLIIIASVVANRSRAVTRTDNRRRNASLAFAVTVAALGVFAGIRTIPSLNMGGSYAGDVSLTHAFEYAVTYVMMDYGGPLQLGYEYAANDPNVQVGRIILVLHIVRWLISVDTMTLWFGAGFGAATPSEWIDGGSDPLFDLLGSRGAISGAGLALVETGLVGLLIISSFFIWVLIMAIRNYRAVTSDGARRWYRTVFIILAVFWYDFFFYSTVLLRTLPLPAIVFAIVASIPLVRDYDRRLTNGAKS